VDSKEIRELIEMISRSNFSTFELEEADGFKLRLVKAGSAPAPATVAAAPVPDAVPPTADPVAPPDDGLLGFDSPIVGTFYRSSGPDAPPFAAVGQTVNKGQVLCIVEAMKVMNEIESEVDAEVVEVCVIDGQPVEFGEILFRLRPLN
jgi:acetyl-CoA carboxylase biotin carboxyl carrier protein